MYLENGEQVELVEKLSDTHALVKQLIVDHDFEGRSYTQVVDEILYRRVYLNPPQAKIKAEIAVLIKEKEKLRIEKMSYEKELIGLKKESHELKSSFNKIQNQITDVNKMIYNRSQIKDAKRIIIWMDKKIMPMIMEGESLDKQRFGLKLSITYEISNNKEQAWVSKLYNDNTWGSADHFDTKYGMEFDLTDEQIDAKIKQRVTDYQSNYFHDQYIRDAEARYLTPALIEKKLELMSKQKAQEKNNLEDSIKRKQKELEELLLKQKE